MNIEQRLQNIIAANKAPAFGCAGAFGYNASPENAKRLAAARLLLCRKNAVINRENGRNHIKGTAVLLAQVAAFRRAAQAPKQIITMGTVHIVADARQSFTSHSAAARLERTFSGEAA